MDVLADFIARWQASGAAERANYQLFLAELCDVLGIARPAPSQADDRLNEYVFERAVTFLNPDGATSPGRIDLYKRGCFVLEAKQGSEKGTGGEAGALFLDLPKKQKRGTAVRGTRAWDAAMTRSRIASSWPTWRARRSASACASSGLIRSRSTRRGAAPA